MTSDPSVPSGPDKCPNCGAPIPARAPQGLCPQCLFAGLAGATEDGANAASPEPARTPEELAPHFPQLEILECLGRGGMGVVYKARQKSLNRFVALKLLAPERVADAKFAERFTHEAQALATLNHPNIVTIHDFGQAGGFYFLLMEFVDGVNLRQAMKAGRFTPEQALAVVPPVCEALQYAHEHGIVHRDIKPENLLLDKEGRVKIADFGIAKMLGSDSDGATRDEEPQTGTLASAAGTPQYMAPEQKEHRVADHRADIYSLGVVLYELLTGELPADKLQPPSSRVRGLQIDVRLDEIVLRALEKTPELRYQTAGEFRTQVETMTGGASVPPIEPGAAGGSLLAYAAMFFAGLSGVLGMVTFSLWPHPPQMLVWSILASALLGIFVGIRARKFKLGEQALIVGCINAGIWLVIAVFGPHGAGAAPPPAGFDPVVERVVVDMIDFDTGELVDLPLPAHPGERDQARFDWLNGPDASLPNKESHPWMRAHGVDAINASHSLSGVDLRPVPLDPSDWTSLTPTALEEKILALPRSPYAVNAFSSSTTTNTFGFQTREGRFGILQITDRDLPRGVKIRYRLAQVAAVETWSPTVAPGAKPDVQAILNEAHAFTSQGRYEEALQRHLWFHHHALEFDPAFTGVRLSFALSYWAELGQRYPKAKQALIETRDRGAKELTSGRGDFALFMEADSINRTLQDPNATDALFKTMVTVNPTLAHQCYPLMEERLVERGEYEACLKYIGDPQARFESIHGMFDVTQKLPDTIPASQQDQIRDHVKRTFVTDTCRLIEILIATKHQPDAEKIRDQAVAALDDARLKSAVDDAAQRIRRHPPVPAASAPVVQ